MNAVRCNDRIRNRGCTIGKGQPDAAVALIQSDQPVAQLDAFVRNYAGQRGVQVSAMGEQIGRAKFLFGALAENHVEFDFACSPVPVVPGARVEGLFAQSGFEPQPTQNLHGVAADLNSGPKPDELRSLLVHRDIDTCPP
jgi:hypothetical protein